MGPRRVGPRSGPRRGGEPEGWEPEGWGAQNFALFFPLPPQNSFFSSLSWRSSPKPPGLHTTTREPKRALEGPGLQKHNQNSTRRPPEREEKNEFCGGRGKKRAKFWAVRRRGGPVEVVRQKGCGVMRKVVKPTNNHTTNTNHNTPTQNNTQHTQTTHKQHKQVKNKQHKKGIGQKWIGQNWIGPNWPNH